MKLIIENMDSSCENCVFIDGKVVVDFVMKMRELGIFFFVVRISCMNCLLIEELMLI